ncbi:hypothetical protein D3C71_1068290 [compost metagenome]
MLLAALLPGGAGCRPAAARYWKTPDAGSAKFSAYCTPVVMSRVCCTVASAQALVASSGR